MNNVTVRKRHGGSENAAAWGSSTLVGKSSNENRLCLDPLHDWWGFPVRVPSNNGHLESFRPCGASRIWGIDHWHLDTVSQWRDLIGLRGAEKRQNGRASKVWGRISAGGVASRCGSHHLTWRARLHENCVPDRSATRGQRVFFSHSSLILMNIHSFHRDRDERLKYGRYVTATV